MAKKKKDETYTMSYVTDDGFIKRRNSINVKWNPKSKTSASHKAMLLSALKRKA